MKIEQLEDGELRTDSLTELVSVKEAGDECSEDSILFDVGNRKVALRTSRAKLRVRALSTSEELRTRMPPMKILFEVTKSKFADRLVFSKHEQAIWDRYVPSHEFTPQIPKELIARAISRASTDIHSNMTLSTRDGLTLRIVKPFRSNG